MLQIRFFFLSSQNLFSYFLNQFLPMFWSCKAKSISQPMPQDKEVLEVLSVSFKCPCWLQTVAMLVVAHQLLWLWWCHPVFVHHLSRTVMVLCPWLFNPELFPIKAVLELKFRAAAKSYDFIFPSSFSFGFNTKL